MSWFDDNDPERPQRGVATTVTPPVSTTPITVPPGTIAPPTGGSAAGLPHGTPPPGWTPQYAPGTAPAGDPVTQFQAYLARHPNDPQAAIDEWNAAGDPGGLKPMWQASSKTIGISGNQYLVQPGTGGNSGADWQTVKRPGAEGGSGADALGSLIAPFTEQFTNPDYVAPTGVNDQNDPGFTARMSAADDALQRSAAAKGSLLSGSTLKALSDWNSDYASNEYAATDSRARQTYATNSQNAYQQYAQRRANFYQNQDSPFAKLFGLAQLDSSNQNQLNQLNLGYAGLGASTLQNPAYASYLTQGGNATAAGQVGAGNAYSGLFGNLGNTGTLGYLASRPPTYPQMGFGY